MQKLVRLIRSENFDQEVITEKRPVLVLCMPRDVDFDGQLMLLEDIAQRYGEDLKIGFLDETFIETFRLKYKISGTPTLMIFRDGQEKKRFLGIADKESLLNFISIGL